MGKDRVPRLRLLVITDDDTGPRLCRGCGGPLTPSVKASAVFCSSVCRSRHWRRMRRARARTEAVQAGVTSSCPECGASWTVEGRTSCLGDVLLSCLPQTGPAQTARGGQRVVDDGLGLVLAGGGCRALPARDELPAPTTVRTWPRSHASVATGRTGYCTST